MFDAKKSRQIYKELMNGKVINKHKLNNEDVLSDNLLFLELVTNEEAYRQQYLMAGYHLEIQPEFILLRDLEKLNSSLKTDATMKIYILLLLIAKYLNDNNYRIDKITDPAYGLNAADIDTIASLETTKEIAEKADLKRDLSSHIKSSLVERGILLEKTGASAYILSDAGKAFFNEVWTKFYDAGAE